MQSRRCGVSHLGRAKGTNLDFFNDMIYAGGSGKGWRSPIAIICTILGLAVGIYAGWYFGNLFSMTALGVLSGWLFGVFLRGFGLFLLIFLAVLGVIFGFEYLQSLFQ